MTALLFEDGDDGAAMAALRALGAGRVESHRTPYNNIVRFELDRGRLAEAAALTDVAWIEPTPVYTANNDLAQWVLQTGVQDQRTVYDHGLRGQGQLVMTADSGVRTNHEMFYDSTPGDRHVRRLSDASQDRGVQAGRRAPGHRVRRRGGVRLPRHAHRRDRGWRPRRRTRAHAGAGSRIRRGSTSWTSAVRPGAVCRCPPISTSSMQPSYEGNAAGPVRLSSNSWGAFTQAWYTLPSMQTDQFVWNHPDYLIGFSSGNTGTFAAVNAPGTAKNVITVGATGNGEFQTKLAPFSSRGPVRDGRRKPTLMAPGDGVTSSIGSTRYTYATYSGTSMATPAVMERWRSSASTSPRAGTRPAVPVASNSLAPSAALMRAMAVAASRNDIVGFRAPDNTIGYGRLTIDDVLYFPGDTLRTLLVDAGDGLSDQQFVEYQVQVTDPSAPLAVVARVDGRSRQSRLAGVDRERPGPDRVPRRDLATVAMRCSTTSRHRTGPGTR